MQAIMQYTYLDLCEYREALSEHAHGDEWTPCPAIPGTITGRISGIRGMETLTPTAALCPAIVYLTANTSFYFSRGFRRSSFNKGIALHSSVADLSIWLQ